MNILLLTTHANTGGITSYILTLGHALVASGHHVWVASSGGDCVSRLEAAGIKHVTFDIRVKSEAHPKLWLNAPGLERLVRGERIHIIHANTRVTQVLGAWVSRRTGVKMVTTCHGFFTPRWFRRVFPCWGEAVIAISKPVARHLNEDFKVPGERICLIANGIDLESFARIDEYQRREARHKTGLGEVPLIGTIARLSDVKGISVLIKAMPDILKQIPAAHLIIAGQGPEEANLKKLALDLSLTDHVHFISTINHTRQLLAALDVFVMPSLMEGLGLSVMEAQACGIPVVASRVGGLVDLIEEGASGYLVPAHDPAALAGRVVEALQDPHKTQMMARQARSNIEQNFSVGRMLAQTLGVYEQYSCC